MAYPPLVHYSTEAEYRSHYERVYCRGPIATFDGIKVRFRKDQFSSLRAPRIDWIKTTLEDPAAELHCGWDKKRKCYDSSHRVAVVVGNYVVVIRLTGSGTAAFVTAYLADSSSTIAKIRQAPQWTPGA